MRPLTDIVAERTHEADDSLIVALRAVLQWAGRPAPYDELCTVSGVAAMATFRPDEPCPARWPAYGRHAFLEETAADYGLIVRDLHPPDAAPLPAAPPEFELHFRDSYLPLIEAAIEHGQPVFAWMGWPEPNTHEWGVVTGLDARRKTCNGCVAGAGAVRATLERAAVQVYVVQDVGAARLGEVDRLAAAVARFRKVMRNDLPRFFNVVTGPSAIRRWREHLEHGAPCSQHADRSSRCAARLLASFAARRRTAARYRSAHDTTDDAYARLAAAIERTIRPVEPLADEQAFASRWASPGGRRDVIDALEQLEAAETQVAADVEEVSP